jgi:hypothetical protein
MEKAALVSSAGLRRAIVNSSALPALLQRLHPKVIGRLIGEIGLHDAGELMALMPRKKLLAVFDESIWKRPVAGVDEVLDGNELIDWLEVWIDVGDAFTAECLAAMSDDYLTLCMARLIRVDDAGALAHRRYENDEVLDDELDEVHEQCDHFGPYLVYNLEVDQGDIVRAVLNAFWSDAPDRLLRILSNLAGHESMLTQGASAGTVDHDMAFERHSHREHQGYVTASGARAFLAFGTTASLEELFMLAEYDNESRRHLSRRDDTVGQHNPVAAEASDEIDVEDKSDESPIAEEITEAELPSHELDGRAAEELQAWLQFLQPAPSSATFLLEHHGTDHRLPLLSLVDELAMEDYDAFEQCERELAYLANVVITGLRSNAAALSADSARNMALATCNLGLELLRATELSADLAREPGLIRLFLIGWRSVNELHERVRQAFERAASIPRPAGPRHHWLGEQVRVALNDLASALAKRNFAAAREAALLLSIAFDRSSCRDVALLLDEIPRFPERLQGAAQPRGARWLESIEDLNRVVALLASLTFRS